MMNSDKNDEVSDTTAAEQSDIVDLKIFTKLTTGH